MFRAMLAASPMLAVLAVAATPALANDSVAELGTGGLVLSRTDAVAMESEDLFISPEKVTVDYVFRNNSDQDVQSIVAFPMPDIEGSPYEMPDMPAAQDDNFLGFEVSIDGAAVKPELEQKAYAAGIDVTADLAAQNVPLFPFGDQAREALAKLPEAVAEDWIGRGIVVIDESDDGSGMKKVRVPYWRLQSAYWWRATFPAHKPVRVSHRYKPSVGATSSLTFFYDGKFQGSYDAYKTRYCIDKTFEAAVRKTAKMNEGGYANMWESRIEYVLTSGGNWALGNIGKFKLTIDKANPKSLVSFCGTNVRKVGPTTFEMTAQEFFPDRDIDILILNPSDVESGGGQ